MAIDYKDGLRSAKQKAKELLEKYKFTKPPIEPSIISKKCGIKVLDCNFDNNNISGYYDFEEKTIYVNRNEFIKRQQFTIAHELGHAILHQEWVNSSAYTCLYRDQLVKPTNDIKEVEANAFAGYLLAPSDMLKEYYNELRKTPKFLHEDLLQQISEIFFVSIPVIRIRLKTEYGYKFN